MNKTVLELKRTIDELKDDNYKLIDNMESERTQLESILKENAELKKERRSLLSECDRTQNTNQIMAKENKELSTRFDHMKNLVRILKQKNPKISEIENSLKTQLESEMLRSTDKTGSDLYGNIKTIQNSRQNSKIEFPEFLEVVSDIFNHILLTPKLDFEHLDLFKHMKKALISQKQANQRLKQNFKELKKIENSIISKHPVYLPKLIVRSNLEMILWIQWTLKTLRP